jgi:hypothetical protein
VHDIEEIIYVGNFTSLVACIDVAKKTVAGTRQGNVFYERRLKGALKCNRNELKEEASFAWVFSRSPRFDGPALI